MGGGEQGFGKKEEEEKDGKEKDGPVLCKNLSG